MLFIDANIFIAYYNVLDVHHAKAVELWQDIESGKYGQYFTSDYIFNEVVGVTFRKFGKEAALILGETILKSVTLFAVENVILKESWKLFSSTPLHLNLVDCSSITVAILTKAEYIATFDQEFKEIKNVKIIG